MGDRVLRARLAPGCVRAPGHLPRAGSRAWSLAPPALHSPAPPMPQVQLSFKRPGGEPVVALPTLSGVVLTAR